MRLSAVGTLGLVLGLLASGCGGKRGTASQISAKASEQSKNELSLKPAAPAPIPMPYPNASAEARDPASGMATGKRMHKPYTLAQ
jgi:hypothetical protein